MYKRQEWFRLFEERKAQFEEMGMFSEEYKKPIPRFAKKVGVVTAKTGAAIQDIINITHRRNPYVQLILYPTLEMCIRDSYKRGIKKGRHFT